MTARARVLAGVAVGCWSAWGVSTPDRNALVEVGVCIFAAAFAVCVGSAYAASRTRRESYGEFATRVLREHGIDAAEVTEPDRPQHVTYVVDVDTFRRIKEHEFLSEGAVRTGGET